jgi:hypothetical protein
MKTTSLFVLFLILSTVAGVAQYEVSRELPPFSGLYVGSKMTLQLVKADKESVTITTEDVDPSSIETKVENNTLKIRQSGSAFSKKKVMVTLNFRNLKKIEISNDADAVTASLFQSDTLYVILSMGGSLYLDADIKYLNSRLSGGGLLTAEGYAVHHETEVSSRATVSAFRLESDTVSVKAISGGKAKLNVADVLNATATTGSYISYKGNPPVKNITVNPGSQVVASDE